MDLEIETNDLEDCEREITLQELKKMKNTESDKNEHEANGSERANKVTGHKITFYCFRSCEKCTEVANIELREP